MLNKIGLLSIMLFIFIIGINAYADTRNWGEPQEGFQLYAVPVHSIVIPDEIVTIKITLRNISNEPQNFFESDPFNDFDLIVKDSMGKIIPLKVRWPKSFTKCMLRKLEPLQEITYEYKVNKNIYNIDSIGEYYIIVNRLIPAMVGNDFANVMSNTVVLKVTNVDNRFWGLEKEGLKLRAELDKAEITSGESIIINFTIKNISNKILNISKSITENDFDLQVTNSAGKKVSCGNRCFNMNPNSNKNINPNEELEFKYNMNMHYKSLPVGRYEIIASRLVNKANSKGFDVIESNAIILTISK